MHVPGVFERVRLCGLDEVYLVTRVDQEAQVADLLPLIYGHRLVESVPFRAMEPIPGCGPPRPEQLFCAVNTFTQQNYVIDLEENSSSAMNPCSSGVGAFHRERKSHGDT